VQIGWIKAVDFRSYRTLSVTPAPRLNVLHGPNGQGKTNLLEALGLLVTGRSFRTPRTADIPYWGAQSAALTGDLVRADAASKRAGRFGGRSSGSTMGTGSRAANRSSGHARSRSAGKTSTS